MALLQMSMQAGILIAAIVIIRTIALNKLPKTSFLVLWGVAVVRMLVPFSFSSKWSIYGFFITLLSHMGTGFAGVENEGMAILNAFPPRYFGYDQNVGIPLSATIIIWLAVMSALFAIFALWLMMSYRQLRFALPFEDNELINEWQSTHKLHRPLKILHSDRIATPLAIGIIRPRIILPKAIDLNDPQATGYVLTHEYFHIYRLDMLWKLLALCAVCIHWFNPLAWVMLVFLNRDLEITCDELVLRHYGRSVNQKRAYAYTLIRMAEARNCFSPIRSYFSKNALDERIASIMKMKKHSVFVVLLALVFVIGMTVAFATTANDDDEQLHSVHNQENTVSIEMGRLVLPLEGVAIKGKLADLERYIDADTPEEKGEVLKALISDPDNTVTEIGKIKPPSIGGTAEAVSVDESGIIIH